MSSSRQSCLFVLTSAVEGMKTVYGTGTRTFQQPQNSTGLDMWINNDSLYALILLTVYTRVRASDMWF